MGAFQWPFDTQFADTVESDPPAPPWVRDWRWLLDHPRQLAYGYLAELGERGLAPALGCNLSTDRRVGLAAIPDDQVRAEFATQEVVIKHEGVPYRLAPAGESGVSGPCPITADVGLVSLTRRIEGVPEEDVLWPAPEGSQVVGAIAADRRWTDRMMVDTPQAAWDRARLTGQLCYVVWRVGPGHGWLEVTDVATGAATSSTPARLTRAVLACPLIPEAKRGQLCMMHGGPWVSASITAAARWSANHANRLADIGCDTCGDGAVLVGPRVEGGPLVRAGGTGPGVIDVETGDDVMPRADGRRWSHYPSENRYGRMVTLESS